jgi:hypothetical protein
VSIAVFIDKTTCDHRAPFTVCELDGASFSGSGLKGPAGIAIDGADVWVTSEASAPSPRFGVEYAVTLSRVTERCRGRPA